MSYRNHPALLLALAAALLGSACSPKALKKGKAPPSAQQAQEQDTVIGREDDQEEASLRYKDGRGHSAKTRSPA